MVEPTTSWCKRGATDEGRTGIVDRSGLPNQKEPKKMEIPAELAQALDELQVCNVRRVWAFSLDLGEWETLRSCFHPNAEVTVSWYAGSIAGFIERSKPIVQTRRPEEHRKHWLGNMRVNVQGTRAVLETDVLIMIREFIDGQLYDYTSYARFYDLFEKREGVWRICKWNCIYDKDRLDPVVPSHAMASLYDQVSLDGHESGFAFMKLRQAKKGRGVPSTIVIRDTEGEKELRREGESWLSGKA
jgi:SnoaL-like domain